MSWLVMQHNRTREYVMIFLNNKLNFTINNVINPKFSNYITLKKQYLTYIILTYLYSKFFKNLRFLCAMEYFSKNIQTIVLEEENKMNT
ncbi:hypothetical protein BpHYR1_039733 [Brachionus plicatilis]|uniref:Uncharacterized protein n=1 Tax=Brachionus plicatilis TaxID=10195 RepID=A0A3M7T6A4_BRAPC|nr:hypothetical protein BpHYR1_039733 [Brachionus plicatilis]